ncbi:MAG: hypothetical protein GXO47_14315 [Chlorobi bacterium]|nr:hypothetical protein [Chlorobiota bacterium]
MGLDIYHKLLTKNESECEKDFYTKEDFDELCNVPFEAFSNFHIKVTDYRVLHTILLFENEEDYNEYFSNDEARKEKVLKVFIGSDEQKMIKQIKQFLKYKKLDHYSLSGFRSELRASKLYTNIFIGEYFETDGVIYNEVGYQRKGMGGVFFEDFDVDFRMFGKKEDFIKAYNSIDSDDWYLEHFGEEYVIKLKNNFEKNFLDKFAFGQSLLVVSQ